ncbi:MAG: hypothetical protein M3Q29_19505 [Chloroflexota bacterium]|nr:hypothetical protein [Chloroflexota bacterium]
MHHPIPPPPMQLVLPLDLPAPQTPPIEPPTPAPQVWEKLSPAIRLQIRQAVLRVLREVIDDARER